MTDEAILLAAVWLGLTLYALLGGADFGAGAWEVWAAFRTPPAERRLLRDAIAPVWEANHVWLIFVAVVLWTAFPGAFTSLLQALWVPLLLALLGIVVRGAGFALRMDEKSERTGAASVVPRLRDAKAWAVAFAVASALTPVFLGAAAGAVATWPAGLAPDGTFRGDRLGAWVSPTAALCAALALGASLHVAAVFLVREAEIAGSAALARTWRRRGLVSGAGLGAVALAGLAVLAADAPLLWEGFRDRGLPFVVASAACGVAALLFLWRGPAWGAVIAASGSVAAIVVGWGAAQFAPGRPPAEFLRAAAAPPQVLRATVVSLAVGAVVLLPSLALLFRVFKARTPPGG